MKPLRVLFISHSSDCYGAEKSLLDLLDGMHVSIVPVVVVPSYGPLTTHLATMNIPYAIVPHIGWTGTHSLQLRKAAAALVNYQACKSIKVLCRNLGIDCLYTNSLASASGAMAAHALGLPHIWHVREFIGSGQAAQFTSGDYAGVSFVNNSTDLVICNSMAIAGHLASLKVSVPLKTIYNGIRFCEDPPPVPERTGGLLMVGSLHPHKNQQEAIKALKIVHSKGHKLTLKIVGSGEKNYRRQLQKCARTCGLEKYVLFQEYTDDVISLYRNGTALVLCANREPWGRVLAEAMAYGCPVISADAGGAPEIVEHGVTGFLYPPGDCEALAACIMKIIKDTSSVRSVTARARELVRKRFTVQRYSLEITESIQECVQKWNQKAGDNP